MWVVKPCNIPFRDGRAAWRFYADCWWRGDRIGLELVEVENPIEKSIEKRDPWWQRVFSFVVQVYWYLALSPSQK